MISMEADDTAAMNSLEAKIEKATIALTAKMGQLGEVLRGKIIDNLSGPILNQVSGAAAGSVRAIPATIEGGVITGGVEAGGEQAPYLWFHEYGGTKESYVIRPVNKKALSFEVDGKRIITQYVVHPGIKKRAPVALATEGFRPEMQKQLQDTFDDAVRD